MDPQLAWLCPGAHRWAPCCRQLGTSRRKPGQKTSRSLVHTSSGLTDWEGGEQLAGYRKETAQSKGGGSVTADGTRSHDLSPHQTPVPISPKKLLLQAS